MFYKIVLFVFIRHTDKDRLFGTVVSTSDCHQRDPRVLIPGYTVEIFLEL